MFSSNFKAFLRWKTDYRGYLSGPIASKKHFWKKTHKKLQLSIVQNHGNSSACKQWACFQPRQEGNLISHDFLPNPKQQMPLKCTKEQGAYRIGNYSYPLLVKERKALKKNLCFATLGLPKAKWPWDKLTFSTEKRLELQRESDLAFSSPRYVFFFGKGLACSRGKLKCTSFRTNPGETTLLFNVVTVST